MGILNLSGGNIICGGMGGMFVGAMNGDRGGLAMPGGCRRGIPSLGPCMIAEPGRAIDDAGGDPSWLSLPASDAVPLSPLESLLDSSRGFILPAGANFIGPNSVGMKVGPPGGMVVGDSMMGP